MAKYDMHIGHLIKSVFDESGMSVSEFARLIDCERTNVYSIFERASINIDLLVKISQTLQYNFLDDVQLHCGLKTTIPTKQLNICIDTINDDKAHRISNLLSELSKEVDSKE
ncbi:MAG: helix-turn-helix transcriptional regulator [Bacteroidales bacterium]|nr:helix-turn-helix transcriptional regulator [Bacteroidales bacterium]